MAAYKNTSGEVKARARRQPLAEGSSGLRPVKPELFRQAADEWPPLQGAALAHLIATPGSSWDADGPEQLAVMQRIGRGSPWFAPFEIRRGTGEHNGVPRACAPFEGSGAT